MREIPEEAFIDLKAIIKTIKEKWYYYLISIVLLLFIGIIYIKITPKVYEVKASVQLKDQSLSDKGTHNEQFINGLELVAGNSAKGDEIGLLSSYNLIEQALHELDFTVSYYSYSSTFGFLGRKMEQELYKDAFQVMLDKTRPQIVGTPVYVSFPDPHHYRIQVEAEEAYILNLEDYSLLQREVPVFIDTTLDLDAPFESKALNFKLNLHPDFIFDDKKGYYLVIKNLKSMAEDYASQLKVSPISEESNIVDLSINSKVPAKEIDFINTLTRIYIAQDLEKKNQLGLKALEFIDKQIALIFDSLSLVEGNLKSFRASNQIIDISTTSKNLTEQLQPLKQHHTQLEVQKQYLQNTLDYLKNNDGVTDVIAPTSVGIHDPFLNSLLIQLDELNREKTEKGFSSNSNNPVLRILEEKIRNTKNTLIANINNSVNSTKIALEENQKRINLINTQFSSLPESERNLKNIERKFQLNDNTYKYLLEKRAEAGIALASNLPDKTIIDYARQIGKEPIAPNAKSILLLCLLAGLSLPTLLIFTQKYFNGQVTNKHELEEALNFPLLGVIPKASSKDKLPVAQQPRSAVAETFRFIRIALSGINKSTTQHANIIGVVSSQEGDGKTFCAVNLALSYARSGKKTLLIGADLRKPRLQEYFDLPEDGLANYLEGKKELPHLINLTLYQNLFVLPSGKTKKDIGELIESPQLEKLFSELQDRFDTIIVDTPPLGPVADFYIFSKYFNYKLFVVRQNHTSATTLKGIYEKLSREETDNLFLVFNAINNTVMKEYGYSGKYEYTSK